MVTAAELLDQAQIQALSLGRSLPPPWPAAGVSGQRRGPMAWEQYRAQEAAWPQLAAAARYALESVPAHVGVRDEFRPVREALEQIERRLGRDDPPTTRTAEPVSSAASVGAAAVVAPAGAGVRAADPRLVHGAQLLAAAGEAMRVERSTASPAGSADGAARAAGVQVAAVVVSFARFTTAYAEQAREPGTAAKVARHPWRSLVERLDCLLEGTDRTTRATDLTLRPVPASAEESVAGVLDRWRSSVDEVNAHRVEVGGLADRDVRLTARGLMFIHAAAAVGASSRGDAELNRLHRLHMGAARGWDYAAAGWSGAIRVPGRPSPTLGSATGDLTRALTAAAARVRAGRSRPQDAQALSHFLRTQVPRIAAEYCDTVAVVVQREHALVPARRMVEAARSETAAHPGPRGEPLVDAADTVATVDSAQVSRDVPRVSVELADAARRGRWVTLASASALASDLTQRTEDAYRASRAVVAAEVALPWTPPPLGDAYDRAGGLPVGGAGLDPEAAQARLVAAAGFSRSTRQSLAAGPGQGAGQSAPPLCHPDRELISDSPQRHRHSEDTGQGGLSPGRS